MRVYYLFISCFIYFITISCTTSEKNHDGYFESPLSEIEVDLVKKDEWVLSLNTTDTEGSNTTIGRLRFDFVTNKTNTNHAFYDELNKHFLITDNRGKIQQIISKEGRGPGEVMEVAGYHFNDQNQLVIYDAIQLMLKIFDLDSQRFTEAEIDRSDYHIAYRHLYPYRDLLYAPIIDVAFQRTDMREVWKSDLIGVFNYEGDLISTFGKYDPFMQEPISYLIFPIINMDSEQSQIISSHADRYSLQIHDIETEERLAWFGRQTEHFRRSEEFISPYASRQTIQNQTVDLAGTVGVYITSKYHINNFSIITEAFQHTRNHNSKEHYLAVYDRETYVSYGEISLPYALGNVVDDTFYLIEDDNPDNFTIGLYELQKKN